MDDIFIVPFYQFKMILKENARLIHEMIALLHLGARSKASSKTIDQALADEISSDLDDTPNNFRSIILGKVVGHQWGLQGKTF